MPEEAILVSGGKTPVGKFGQALKNISAPHLGAIVMKETLNRVGIQMHEGELVNRRM